MPFRFAPLVCLAFSSVLLADQVVLKNGDRFTGEVIKSDAKTMTFKSEFAGVVTIQWDSIVSVTTEKPVALTLSDGQVFRGTLSTVDGNFRVVTSQTGELKAAKSFVTSIRSQAEQTAYETQVERLRNPGLLDLWSGYIDTGLALSRGNSRTTTFNVGANANRTTTRDKIGVHFTSLQSTNSTTGVSETVANLTRGGIRYDLNVSPKAFTFGFTDLEFDEFQKLDLRFVIGGGGGYHVYRRGKSFFDLSAGASLNKEFFQDNVRRSSAELLFGDELVYDWKGITTFNQKLVVYPNISNSGAYRINWDSGAVTRISRWLSWQITISDRFLSNPVPGARKNDILMGTDA
jgi:putative salt-induced outer membrane protein